VVAVLAIPNKLLEEPILPAMVIRDAVTTEEYRHQKGEITVRILTTKRISAK